MRRTFPPSIAALFAAVVVAASLSACSPASGRQSAAKATPSPTPSIDAFCVQGPADAVHVSHFPSADGSEQIEGYTLGTGTVGVVLAHQLDETLCEWKPRMGEFAAKGYRVMAITMKDDNGSDVAGAVAALRKQGATKIVLIGASMGGAAVVDAGVATTPPVQGVVSLSGALRFLSQDGIAGLKKTTVPFLYVESKQDSVAGSAQAMYGLTASSAKTLTLIDGSSHGVDLWLDVEDQVFAFIAKVTA
jgi:pimeloyl-ACP methyl ester carboxylesterase